MKQCSACKTTYTDDTLKFCLADGAALIELPNSEKTIEMSFGGENERMNIPADSTPTVFPAAGLPKPDKKSSTPIIAAVAGLFLLLVIAALIGFVSYISLRSNDNKDVQVVNSQTPVPTISETPESDKENTELKEKLANLEKQIAAQKNQKKLNKEEVFSASQNSEKTARANSPDDGFLALRSEPNSESGERLAKIPHGATITVLGCPKSSNVGKMSGRWCQVIYNGQAGWAFSAYMIF